MVSINSEIGVQKRKRRDLFITISLALYILPSYFFFSSLRYVLPTIGSALLYIFLGLTFFKLITGQTPLKITAYSIGYIVFMILGSVSFFYALDTGSVLTDLYLLFVSLVLTFSFIQYVQDNSGFMRIFSFYAYFPIFIILYFLMTGQLTNPGQRLGEWEYGNSNNLAINLMVSLCCIFWLTIYGKRKYFWIDSILALVYLYVTSLTGGRKYLLIPLVFLFLILMFKYWRKNKSKLIFYLIFFALVICVVLWAVTNIPILYNQIGVRFEGLLNFVSGDVENTDDSTLIRYIMIDSGWRWFGLQPIQGYGLNNFRVLIAEILGGAVYAHNNFIELMVDLGAIGLLVYYSIYGFLIAKLIAIRNDTSGLRNFFLAFMLVLFIFEMGAVTYQLYIIQIFVGLASAYLYVQAKNRPTNIAQVPVSKIEGQNRINWTNIEEP